MSKALDLLGTGSVVGMFEEMVKDGVEYAGIVMTAEELRTAALDLMQRTMVYAPPSDEPKYAGAGPCGGDSEGEGAVVTLDHTTHGLGRTRRWAHGDGRTGQVEHPLDDRLSDMRVDEAMRQQAASLGAVSERDFQRQVIELAETMGWELIYHTMDSPTEPGGVPGPDHGQGRAVAGAGVEDGDGASESRAEGVDRRDAAGDRRARSDRAPAGSAGARGRCAQRTDGGLMNHACECGGALPPTANSRTRFCVVCRKRRDLDCNYRWTRRKRIEDPAWRAAENAKFCANRRGNARVQELEREYRRKYRIKNRERITANARAKRHAKQSTPQNIWPCSKRGRLNGLWSG